MTIKPRAPAPSRPAAGTAPILVGVSASLLDQVYLEANPKEPMPGNHA